MSLFFYIGKSDLLDDKKRFNNDSKKLDFIKTKISEVLDIKNLSFLLGAGCSSLKIDNDEIGVPTMKDMIKDLYLFIETYESEGKEEIYDCFNDILSKYQDTDEDKKIVNLENFLGYLIKKENVLRCEGNNMDATKIKNLINKIAYFIFYKCSIKSKELLDIYKNFYKKLLLRQENLPRVNIFTTNYDLFSEKAMDENKIIYNNGFSGFIDRQFSPAIFTYMPYRDIEINSNELLEVSNYFYLYKLHGSINWIGGTNGIIKEIQDTDTIKSCECLMIYPTPLKHEIARGIIHNVHLYFKPIVVFMKGYKKKFPWLSEV